MALTGPPVDGSPVAWEGQGPVVYVSYDRGRPGRLHHIEGSFARASGFDLRSPVRTVAAPPSDAASRSSGRYEYRRYPFRDLGMSGFDLGIGIEGNADRVSFVRHFEPALELHRGLTNFGVEGVVAASLHRWMRWSLVAAWGNGLSIGSGTSNHRGGAEASTIEGWGGGWQSHLQVRGTVHVAGQSSVYAAWLTSGEGRFASHDSFTFGGSRFTMGVTYGR